MPVKPSRKEIAKRKNAYAANRTYHKKDSLKRHYSLGGSVISDDKKQMFFTFWFGFDLILIQS